jgi:hypothetical protein
VNPRFLLPSVSRMAIDIMYKLVSTCEFKKYEICIICNFYKIIYRTVNLLSRLHFSSIICTFDIESWVDSILFLNFIF